ncbi:MAG: cupin domain-containing protein [Candidatus Cybelea sp.]
MPRFRPAYGAAHLLDRSGYTLVGCDVAPGFEFGDFEV